MTSPLMNEHEIGFRHFLHHPGAEGEILELLGNPKRRGKVLNRLNHAQDIDLSLARPVPPGCLLSPWLSSGEDGRW